MSVLLMAVGLVVNRSHRDLEAETRDLAAQVTEARGRYDELVAQHKRLDAALAREQQSALDQLLKLESEYVLLRQRNQGLSEELAEQKQQRADATKRVAEAQETNNQLAEDVSQLRTDIEQNADARQKAFDDSLVATETLHQLQGQLEATLERRRDLREDLGLEQ
jgi:chromosome segregation ATPase